MAQALLDAYQYTTLSGTQDLEFGDKVKVKSDYIEEDLRGAVFQYLGTSATGLATVLDTVDFAAASHLDYWRQVTATNVKDFADLMILSMAFPNILGVVLLSGKVKRALDDYWSRFKAGKLEPKLVAAPQPEGASTQAT